MLKVINLTKVSKEQLQAMYKLQLITQNDFINTLADWHHYTRHDIDKVLAKVEVIEFIKEKDFPYY